MTHRQHTQAAAFPASHLLLALGIGAMALVAGPASATVISVDFGTTSSATGDGPSPTTSGAEAAATSANAGFGAAQVWNAVAVGEFNDPATVNPGPFGLRDSSGAATGVGLSLTGSVKGFSGFNDPGGDALRKDCLFFNSDGNPGTTLSWQLTGLTAGAADDLFVYGSDAGNAGWTMAMGAQQRLVGGDSGTAYFRALVADANGLLGGSLLSSGVYDNENAYDHDVNWSGFQLLSVAAVPEPRTWALMAAGLLGLGALARRQRG